MAQFGESTIGPVKLSSYCWCIFDTFAC